MSYREYFYGGTQILSPRMYHDITISGSSKIMYNIFIESPYQLEYILILVRFRNFTMASLNL